MVKHCENTGESRRINRDKQIESSQYVDKNSGEKSADLNTMIRNSLQKLYNADKQKNRKSYFSIKKAMDSFSKCRREVKNIDECLSLPYFGRMLCERLRVDIESKYCIETPKISNPEVMKKSKEILGESVNVSGLKKSISNGLLDPSNKIIVDKKPKAMNFEDIPSIGNMLFSRTEDTMQNMTRKEPSISAGGLFLNTACKYLDFTKSETMDISQNQQKLFDIPINNLSDNKSNASDLKDIKKSPDHKVPSTVSDKTSTKIPTDKCAIDKFELISFSPPTNDIASDFPKEINPSISKNIEYSSSAEIINISSDEHENVANDDIIMVSCPTTTNFDAIKEMSTPNIGIEKKYQHTNIKEIDIASVGEIKFGLSDCGNFEKDSECTYMNYEQNMPNIMDNSCSYNPSKDILAPKPKDFAKSFDSIDLPSLTQFSSPIPSGKGNDIANPIVDLSLPHTSPNQTHELLINKSKHFSLIDKNYEITPRLDEANKKQIENQLYILVMIDYMDLVLSNKRYNLESSEFKKFSSGKALAYVDFEDLKEEFAICETKTIIHSTPSGITTNIDSNEEPIISKFEAKSSDMKVCRNIMPATEDIEAIKKLENDFSMIFSPDFSIHNPTEITDDKNSLRINSIQEYIIQESIYVSSLQPGTFDIHLLVDNSEPDFIHNELRLKNIKCEKKKLNVGDFTWIARSNDSQSDENDVVLDLIIERKRSDDLASSICDGRFSEQKSRLKKTFISNIFYLHEKSLRPSNIRFNKMLNPDAIRQALFNTLICDGFFVKQTKNVDGTIDFLVSLTKLLKDIYLDKTLWSMSYNEFIGMKNSCKFPSLQSKQHFLMNHQSMDRSLNKTNNLTIRELFAQSILKIPGVGLNRAIEIVKKYPTPNALIQKYKEINDENEKVNLLADIGYGPRKKKIGQLTSKAIYEFFMKDMR
ncbi:MAG: Crossover junction endonuclease mus81 [Marteilia pararefringens]